MNILRRFLLAAGVAGWLIVTAGAAETGRFAGRWQLDAARSTSIKPWEQAELTIAVTGDAVEIVRRLQWGPDRKVSDTTRAVADNGGTVTANPVEHWLDTWYTNVYLGGDKRKHVTAGWVDGGRTLKLETGLMLEAQQGDYPVHIYTQYRLSPDGNTLTQFELRSTRDQALVYVWQRVPAAEARK